MLEAPVGTVTFLITDIEGSTRRWEDEPDTMRIALADHDAVLRTAIEANGGWAFKNTGDGVLAAFSSARSAIEAAIAAQRKLGLPVRMGICSGEAELRAGNYFGATLNRASRMMAAGHGGQVLVAASTAALLEDVELVDLGVHRLRDLSQPQQLYQVRADGLKSDFPALKTLDAALGNLPTQRTSFLGRDKDLAELAVLLRGSRLVTLTGVGGVGKTRLALQVAAEISADYPDGAWIVELAAIGDPDATEHAVAGALGIAQQSGKTVGQSIVASLTRRRLLLVLDNCEHLIEAAATLASEILTRCPRVTVLATSREALMVDGEQIWPVPSLAVRGGTASPAVELFAERARAVVPKFEMGSDAETVSEICRRLDGIPLAIELAAARVRVMSPGQIRSRLDDRFRLLTGGARRALERHQTLRHAVQWSYDLLSPAERGLLARCSVFAGGFTLEAAEHIGNGDDVAGRDVLELLDSLVRKSLVTAERSNDVMRYGLLETIRQFAEERLADSGEAGSARQRHAQFFAEDAELHFEVWRGPRQRVSHEWLDREIDNLRAAFRWAVEHNDIASAARIGGVGEMARNRLREEAAGWSAQIADAARAIRYRRLPVLLTWAASSAWALGRWEEANRYGEEAIALADDPEFEPFLWACGDLAFVAAFNGDTERALALVESGAKREADAKDRMSLAHVPYFMALSGRRQEAREASDGIVATVERAELPLAMLLAYYGKGYAFADTDPEVAVSAFERVVEVARDSGNLMFETMAIPQIAILQARSGDPIAALDRIRVMLDAWRGTAEALLISHGLGGLAVLFARLGRLEAAALLHGMLEKTFPSNPFIEDLPKTIARVRGALGESLFEEIIRRGGAMDLHQVIDYAQTEIARASCEHRCREI